MNQTDAKRTAVTSAQLVMKKAGGAIEADGKWGSYTQGVYERVDPQTRAVVDSVLASVGTSASALRAARAEEKATGKLALASATDVKSAIKAAAQEAGIDFQTLNGFAWIESRHNPKAANGSSKGLCQMQPAAWAEAKKVLPDLPAYEVGVFDALQNARAAAAYMKVNLRMLRRMGFTDEPTPVVMYLAHQQGAAGFMELWKTAKGQSVTTNYVKPQNMLGNPPPDGKGKTTNKAEFYRRWYAAADRLIDGAP